MPIFINDIPVSCINLAAITFSVPATLIVSILKNENGKIGEVRKNKNNTFDYGPFQINSVWIKEIEPFGFTKEDIQFDRCKATMVATWIIAKGLAQEKSAWEGVGNYHSHTPKLNNAYHTSVQKIHQKISEIIT